MNEHHSCAAQGPRTVDALDGHIDVVLAALGEAEPEKGLEHRVLQRLAAEAAVAGRVNWRRRYLRPGFALPAALAVGVVCTAMVLLRHAAPAFPDAGRLTRPASRSASVPVPAPVIVAGETNPATGAAKLVRARAVRQERGRAVVTNNEDGIASLLAHDAEASFPAPPMPLTEQERLLLRIAHRNDPVQIALLDPVERDLQRGREQAESARFFAPPPLPHDLQQEINAALRSQYVNTPPPRELLAQTADRTIP